MLVGAALFLGGGLTIGQPFFGLGVVIGVIGLLVCALDLVRNDGTPQAPPMPPPYMPPPPYQAAPPPPPRTWQPPPPPPAP